MSAQDLEAASAPTNATAERLGRFGHHPDPACDFCIEVETLQSRLSNALHGLAKPGDEPEPVADVAADIDRAMTFSVGGDPIAVNAKVILRDLHRQAKDVPPAGATAHPAAVALSALLFHGAPCHDRREHGTELRLKDGVTFFFADIDRDSIFAALAPSQIDGGARVNLDGLEPRHIDELRSHADKLRWQMTHDERPAPPHGWTCFHCAQTFTTWPSAAAHFGDDPIGGRPMCCTPTDDDRALAEAAFDEVSLVADDGHCVEIIARAIARAVERERERLLEAAGADMLSDDGPLALKASDAFSWILWNGGRPRQEEAAGEAAGAPEASANTKEHPDVGATAAAIIGSAVAHVTGPIRETIMGLQAELRANAARALKAFDAKCETIAGLRKERDAARHALTLARRLIQNPELYSPNDVRDFLAATEGKG